MEEPDAGQSASGSLPLVAGGSSAKTGTRVFQSARRSKGQPGVGFDANTIRHSGIGRAGRAGPSASGSLPGGGSSADGCRTITRRRKALTTQGLDANTILHSKEEPDARQRVGLATLGEAARKGDGNLRHAPPRSISYACFRCNYSLSGSLRRGIFRAARRRR